MFLIFKLLAIGIRTESAPLNISCQRKPSIVIIKTLPDVGTDEAAGCVFFFGSGVNGTEEKRKKLIKMFFMCNGFAKQ